MGETEDSVTIGHYTRNGVTFPEKLVGRCLVCNHPDRVAIETLYMQGMRPTRIIQTLGNGLAPRNISTHFQNGHVAPHKELIVSTMLARAEEQGTSLDEWEETQRKEILITEMVVDKFRARLIDPNFEPDFKEGLAATKLLYEMTSGDNTSFDATDMYVALSLFMAHTRSIIAAYAGSDVQPAMDALSKLLQADPMLKTLISKSKSEESPSMIDAPDDEDEEIHDAELVEIPVTYWEESQGEEIPFDEPDDEE